MTKEWICPKGHVFTLWSGYFPYLDEYQTYLDPNIGGFDSPCFGCTGEEQEGCVLTVAAHFEGESDG